MTLDQSIAFAVLAATLVLFIWGRWRYDLVAMMALLVLTATGIVPAGQAFSGFGHAAVITVASVLVIGAAVQRSGLVEAAAHRITRIGRHATGQVLLLTGLVALCSAVMNNVAALALLMPIAISSAEAVDRPVSQVLMPLSFGSLLGGLTTLMGTPPNIIIATIRQEAGGEAFSVFDFTPVGAGVALVGVLFVGIVGWRLIPERRARGPAAERLFEISDYVSEARVPDGSRLIGRPLGEAAQDAKAGGKVVGVVRERRRMLAPSLGMTLLAGDVLILEADPKALQAAAASGALDIIGGEKLQSARLQSDEVALVEAVISPGSGLDDRPASPARFRARFGINLLAVSRQGRPLWRGLSDIRLRIGDVLLLQGRREGLRERLAYMGCLPLAERAETAAPDRPSALPGLIFVLAIVLTSMGALPVQIAFAAAAVLVVLLGSLPLREAYSSIHWPIIILIGALLPVGEALRSTGATDLIAHSLLSLAGAWPTYAVVALLIVVSMALSDIINNAAAAIVMGPLALSVATDLGLPADPFLMAVAVGSSCTFLTPIGHQSNTLVLGPGGYKFGDYWRMGLPLDALVVLVATVLITLVWGP
jgi:di/tricarboxylate transporter